jgi:hypothetical protein
LSDHTEVGAWVVKAEPNETWDYFESVRQLPSTDPLERGWTLGESYRNRLIRPGDLIAIWVTGSRRPGIYEIGVVTEKVTRGFIDEAFLIDRSRAGVEVPIVPFTSHRLRSPLPRRIIKANAILRDSEQIRAPRMTNPTFFTPTEAAQFARTLRKDDLRDGGWSRRLYRVKKFAVDGER